jgi:hypothetical protein
MEKYAFYTPILDMGEEPLVITKTREEVLNDHWEWWKVRMVKLHGENSELITAENCIADWCSNNRAWKVVI